MYPKPRSLILDLFGEYLRFTESEVRLGHLTTLMGAFDVAPPTIRVTLSRLRREGWFTSQRSGRETIYRLTDSMLAVLDEGRRRIFAPPPSTWSGSWTMVIYQLSEGERHERAQLRKSLAWHGFGPLTTSTWLAPGDRRAVVRELITDLGEERVDVMRCQSDGQAEDRALTRRCWDLSGLAADYDLFNAQHSDLLEQAAALTGPEALVQRTLLISRFRHFPFRDPQLPPELLPTAWPGDRAFQIFTQAHRALGPAARDYVASVVRRPVIDAEEIASMPTSR